MYKKILWENIREYGATVAETARRFSAMFGATTDRVCGRTVAGTVGISKSEGGLE